MTLLSDIVMDESEVEIEGESVGICPIDGDRRFVFDSEQSQLWMRSSAGNDRVLIDADNGWLGLHRDDDWNDSGWRPTVEFVSNMGSGRFGNDSIPGQITVQGGYSDSQIRLSGSVPRITMSRSDEAVNRIELDGQAGSLTLGDPIGEADGELRMTDTDGETRLQLLGGRADGKENSDVSDEVRFFLDGKAAELSIGGNGENGRIVVRDSDGSGSVLTPAQLRLGTGDQGESGWAGRVAVESDNGYPVCDLDGSDGSLTLGGGSQGSVKPGAPSVEGEAGILRLKDEHGELAGSIEADSGALIFRDADGTEAMRIENGAVTEP